MSKFPRNQVLEFPIFSRHGRSRKAVGPVYMNLNINTSVHVKERHRLFVVLRDDLTMNAKRA